MRIGARPAAAPRRLRRPAAAVIPEPAVPGGRRVRRRPAAGEGGGALDVPGEAVEPAEVVLEKFHRGEEVEGVRLAPGVLGRGEWLVANKGSYYQQPTSFAFKVEREELEGGEREVAGILTGTESEPLLRFGSGENLAVYKCTYVAGNVSNCGTTRTFCTRVFFGVWLQRPRRHGKPT